MLEPGRVQGRVVDLGVNVDTGVLEGFLSMSRAEQSAVLRSNGLTDPGGSLADPDVADYILGQWLAASDIDDATGALLQLQSGLMPSGEAVALLRDMEPGDMPVSAAAISDTESALPELGHAAATERARAQTVAMNLRGYLADQLPYFSYVRVMTWPTPHLRVGNAGPSSEVATVLGDRGMVGGVGFEIVETKYTRDELDELVDEVSTQLRPEFADGDIQVSASRFTDEIVITPSSAAVAEQLRNMRQVSANSEISIAPVEAPAKPESIIGGWPTTVEGGAEKCTFAFTVVVQGESMLTSAGHCFQAEDPDQYYGFIPLDVEDEELAGNVDGALLDFDNAYNYQVDNKIHRYEGLSDQTITGRTAHTGLDVDDLLCHQGRVTGASCAAIFSINDYDPSWVPGTSDGFIKLTGENAESQPGDSGGPWTFGNTAAGIHAGGNGVSPPNGVVIMTTIDRAESGLGFTVLTK